MEPKYIKILYIQSQSADPSPPLGTVIGNLGANTVSFCNSFNLFTKNLSSYFLLKVIIYIYPNFSVSFKVQMPSVTFFLKLLKYDKSVSIRVHDRFHEKIISCVKLYTVIKLALFRFSHLDLKKSLPIIFGVMKSMNLIIDR